MFDPFAPESVQHQLFAQRRIFVSGPLEGAEVAQLSAQLMALDGRSSREVELVLNSPGGPMLDVLSVIDVIKLMRAPVDITCIGIASGTAACLLACGTGERRATPRATISLRCVDTQQLEGTATDIADRAEQMMVVRSRLLDAVAEATGRDRDTLGHELDGGRPRSAEEAIDLGLIDRVVGGAR